MQTILRCRAAIRASKEATTRAELAIEVAESVLYFSRKITRHSQVLRDQARQIRIDPALDGYTLKGYFDSNPSQKGLVIGDWLLR